MNKIVEKKYWPIDESEKNKTCVLHISRHFNTVNNTNNINYAKKSKKRKTQTIFIVIPGNPGAPHFYQRLICELLDMTSDSEILEAYCLGHTGHTATDNVFTSFSFIEQTEHKIFLLRKQIFPKLFDNYYNKNNNTKIVLCGHSIGGWICIDIMRQLHEMENEFIKASLCLFPTVMHIGASPNGQKLGPLIGNKWIRESSAIVLNCLRNTCFQKCLINFVHYMQQNDDKMSMDYEDATIVVKQLFHPYVVRNAMYMGDTEMRLMKGLDAKTIKKHVKKIFFYYGPKDGWTQPISKHLQSVRKAVVNSKYSDDVDVNHMVRVDTHELPHACALGPTVKLLASVIVDDYIRDLFLA